MIVGINGLTQAKKAGKKVLAHGFGISKMMDRCYKKGLSNNNSTLIVRDSSSLDSEWWVVSKWYKLDNIRIK